MYRQLTSLLLLALVAACSSSVPSTNQYDPEGNGPKAGGRFTGTVILFGRTNQANIDVHIFDDAGVRVDDSVTSTDDAGEFITPELKPGTYSLEVLVPVEFMPILQTGIDLLPGQEKDLGVLTSSPTPPVGVIQGTVVLEDTGEGPGGVRVVATRTSGEADVSYFTLSDPTGGYSLRELPAGDYEIRADRSAFTPDLTSASIAAVRDTVTPRDMRLYPASAVARFEVDGPTGIITGAKFTNDPAADMLLLEFGGVNEMRLSEYADMRDSAGVDVPWTVFNSTTTFNLSPDEGVKTVYSQFRVCKDNTGCNDTTDPPTGERLRTEIFATTITLDQTAPEILAFTINNGAAFLTDNDGSGTGALSFTAQDPLSGVSHFRATAAVDFTDEAFLPADSTGSYISQGLVLALGDADGEKTVLLQLRDRAGNVTPSTTASIFRDKTVPATAVPVITVDPAQLDTNGAVASLQVKLTFDVTGDRTDEPLYMAVSNSSGLGASSEFQPLLSPYEHTLTPGSDALPREVCVIFKDAAGLLTQEYCLDMSMDRSGGLFGDVELEETSDYAGVLVQLVHPTDPNTIYSALTINDVSGAGAPIGRFNLADVPSANGYVMRYSKDGFIEEVRFDVTVIAGLDQDRGLVIMRVPRASVTGVISFVDKGAGQHAGIVVTEDSGQHTGSTGPTGGFFIEGLAARAGDDYFFAAHFPGYIRNSFEVVQNLQPGEIRDLGIVALQKQEGDYRICAGNDVIPSPCASIAFTSSRTVRLDLDSPQPQFRVSLDSTFGEPGTPLAFSAYDNSAIHTFDIPALATDGPKAIFVQFGSAETPPTIVDPAISGVVTLDTEPPVPASTDALLIDPDSAGTSATYSNHIAGLVSLQLSAADSGSGVASVRIVNQAAAGTPDFSSATAQPFAAVMPHSLDIISQGEKWVYVQFCDAVGNCTAPVDCPGASILYDTEPPSTLTGVAVRLNGGATETNTPFATIELDTGDAVALRYGESESLAGTPLLSVSPGQTVSFPQLFSLGDGAKTIYAQFVDAAGNASAIEPNPHSASITLDTLPPTVPSIAILGGNITNQDGFTTQLIAGEAEDFIVHLGDAEDFSAETWQPFAGTLPTWTDTHVVNFPGAPIADGTFLLWVRFRDSAGNETRTLSEAIVRDTQAPQLASAEILEGEFTSTQAVNLVLFAVGATQMVIAEDGTLDGELPIPYAPTTTVNLQPAGDGLRTVAVQFLDDAGNATSTLTDSITVDGQIPDSVTFSIANAPFTDSTAVVLDLSANGAASMMLSNDSGFLGGSWEPYGTSKSWALPPTEGLKTVYAKFRDAAGNATATFQAQTTFDATPPGALSVTIDADTGFSTDSAVDLSLAATDTNGVTNMMIANDAAYSGGSWVAFAASHTGWALSAGEGPKTVFVRFRDIAGNVSEAAAAVVVDSAAPTGTLILAGGSATVTGALNVPASITAASDTINMKFVEGTGVNCAAETIDVAFNPNTTYSFTGSPADGALQLTVCLSDRAGLIGSAETSVVLDTADPVGTLSLNGGDNFTSSAVISLSVGATDTTSGVSGIRIANQQDMAGLPWEPYLTARSWTVDTPTSDGLKTIWLEVRDAAGHTHTNISATITLDTATPTGSITINEGAVVQSATVSLAITRGDTDTIDMALSQTFIDCGGATYGAFSATPADETLTQPGNPKTLYLCLRDRAGNTAGFSTSVTVDTADPTGSLSINNLAPYATTTAVTLDSSVAADVTQMKVANGSAPDCTVDTGYVTYNAAANHALTNTDGTRTVYMCIRDASKRYLLLQDSIALDQVNPVGSTVAAGRTGVAIDSDATYATTTSVTLTLGATDATAGVTEMLVSPEATCSAGAWQPYGTSSSQSVAGGDGVSRSMSVKYRDAAGRESPCYSDSITVDTLAPSITQLQLDGGGVSANYTDDATVSVETLDFVNNCDSIELAENTAFTGATSFACATTWPSNYTLGNITADGIKYIFARVLDAAGNASPLAQGSVILDTGGPTNTSITINGGDTHTNNQILNLSLVAAGATEMKVTENATCVGGTWESFTAARTLSLVDTSTGSKTISVEYRDAASNGVGSCNTDAITYDAGWVGGGSVSITTISGENGYTTSTEVTLTLVAGESTNAEMKLSNGGACSGGTWEPYAGSRAWTLASPGEASRDVSVRYRDQALNTSACYTTSVNIDTVAPSGASLVIDTGANYSTSATGAVALAINASETYRVRVAEDPDLSAVAWNLPAAVTPFTLSAGNGAKTVYMQVRDAAGNITPTVVSDSIVLDNTSPTGTLVIAGGSASVTAADGLVTLDLSGSDNLSGLSTMRFRVGEDDDLDTVITWEAWQTSVAFQTSYSNLRLAAPYLTQDSITRYVECEFTDVAGNTSTALADNILLDNVGPTLGASPILINADDASTTSQVVTLSMSASASTTIEMQISNGQGCAGGGAWQAYAATVSNWSLDGSGDDVTKYASAKFRDAAGNETACSDDQIQVDNTPPVAQYVTIDSGAEFSGSDTLNLTISFSGNASNMYIASTEAALAGASALTPTGTTTFDVTGASDGPLTVFVQFEDGAGNRSNAMLDTINRDTTAPVGPSISIDGGARFSNDAGGSTTLTLSAVDIASDVVEMRIRNGVSGAWTVTPYSQTHTGWILGGTSANDVVRTVQAQFVDTVGNVSAVATDTIRQDNVAPTPVALQIQSLGGNTAYATSTQVLLTLSATGASTMEIANNGSCSGGSASGYTTSIPWTLTQTGDGVTATVSITYADAAGNESSCTAAAIDTITVDTVVPVLQSIALRGQYSSTGTLVGSMSGHTGDRYIRIASWDVTGTFTSLEFSLEYTFATVFQSVATGTTLPYNTLSLPAFALSDGAKTIYARATDAAGNRSAYIATSMRYDTTGPSGLLARINSDSTYTNDLDFLMTVYGSDAGEISSILFNSASNACTDPTPDDSTAWNGRPTYHTFTHASAASTGTKRAYLCLVDAAGNKSSSFSDAIVYDGTIPSSASISVIDPVSGALFSGGTAGTDRCSGGSGTAGGNYVPTASLKLRMSASDNHSGVTEIKFTQDTDGDNDIDDTDFASVDWRAHSNGATVSVSGTAAGTDGAKLFGLRARDEVGNERDATPLCITLDTTPPEDLTVTFDAGAYTSSNVVDVTIGASDFQTNSQNMRFCFGRNSHIWGGSSLRGIRTSANAFIGYESTSTICSGTSYWYSWPADDSLKIHLLANSGDKRLQMFVKDAASNKTDLVQAIVELDSAIPGDPTLNVVQPGNRSAHLYWTAPVDSGSGLASYDIRYTPSGGSAVVLSVDGGLEDYIITGLTNRVSYDFEVRAIDNAGQASAWVGPVTATIGWKKSTAAFSGSMSIVPFGISEYEGTIIVGFLQYEILWGEPNSTMHIARSTDGGVTWTTLNVDTRFMHARETAEMYFGPEGLTIVGHYEVDTGSDPNYPDASDVGDKKPRVYSWHSTNLGNSFSRTLLSSNTNGYYSRVEAGVALAKEGGALVAYWQRYHTSSGTDEDVYSNRSHDGGKTWSGTTTADIVTTAVAKSLEACGVESANTLLFQNSTTFTPYRTLDSGRFMTAETGITGKSAKVACTEVTDLQASGRAFALYFTTSGSTRNLNVRRKDNLTGSAWGAEVNLRTGTGGSGTPDATLRPGFYAHGMYNGINGIAAYRDLLGDLWVGQTVSLTNSASWTWSVADDTGDAGTNLVLNGSGGGNPLIAYTDSSGSELFVLSAPYPAPQPRPRMADETIGLSWTVLRDEDGYELDVGASSFAVPNTSYQLDNTEYGTVRVAARDENQQPGEKAYAWELRAFDNSASAGSLSATASYVSRTGGYMIDGSTHVMLAPYSASGYLATGSCNNLHDVCVLRSTDSGTTWTTQVVYNNTAGVVYRNMAFDPDDTSTPILHMVQSAYDDDLYYRRSQTPYSSWTDFFELHAAGATPTLEAQVATASNDVVATWVERTASTYNIYYRYNEASGASASWSALQNVGTANLSWEAHYPSIAYIEGGASDDLAVVFLRDRQCTMTILGATTGLVDVSYLAAYSTSNFDTASPSWTYSSAGSTCSTTLRDIDVVQATSWKRNVLIAFIGHDTVKTHLLQTEDKLMVYFGSITNNNTLSFGELSHVVLDGADVDTASFDVWYNETGAYIVYRAEFNLFGYTHQQLKLAYCKRQCGVRSNWTISALDSTSAGGTHYKGAQVGVDPQTGNLSVVSSEDGSPDAYRLRKDGKFFRKK